MIDSFKVLFDKVIADDVEDVTVIYNDDVSKEDLATIKGWLEAADVEYEMYFGGQEIYSLLIFGE